jgi:hypothetical protein
MYTSLIQHSNKEAVISMVNVPSSTPHNEMDGAIQWFTFHRGALAYPINPHITTQTRMKQFINAIPLILRCRSCSLHAEKYIEHEQSLVDDAVKSREHLHRFFVDFHNYVNKQSGKQIMGYDEAKELYNRPWKAVFPTK